MDGRRWGEVRVRGRGGAWRPLAVGVTMHNAKVLRILAAADKAHGIHVLLSACWTRNRPHSPRFSATTVAFYITVAATPSTVASCAGILKKGQEKRGQGKELLDIWVWAGVHPGSPLGMVGSRGGFPWGNTEE